MTPSSKLIFHLMGALAEFERALIREHTNAGRASASGRVGGRPRKLRTNGKSPWLGGCGLPRVIPFRRSVRLWDLPCNVISLCERGRINHVIITFSFAQFQNLHFVAKKSESRHCPLVLTRIYRGNDARTPCCFLADIAPTSWTQPRPRNGHCLHRIPTISPSEQNQQLPLTFSCCHDLRHSPSHLCTRMRRLLPQRGLDLFKIR
jgi:hypothetical protein